ncbi:MAG TPA: alpha/beta hydrolase [Bacteroidota bacterium]
MKKSRVINLALLLVVLLSSAAVGQQQSPIKWEPYELRLTDGSTEAAEVGRLVVPERRSVKDNRQVTLGLVRLPAKSGAPNRSIIYLGGSPGGIASSDALRIAPLFPFFETLREAGDVIVMDYRGSGLSTPKLTCPPAAVFSVDAFASREKAVQFFLTQAVECARRLRAEGVSLDGYTWLEVAHDVEDLRNALGTDNVDLVGFSAGTHAALAAIRAHEAGIRRVVLIGTEGPDNTRKLPSMADQQLAQIGVLVRADQGLSADIPNFLDLVHTTLNQLELKPVEIEVKLPGSGALVRGPVGRFAISFVVAKSLSGPDEFDLLPRLFYTLSRGDLSVLTRVMQRFVDRPPPNPLTYIMDGASGVSEERWKRIEVEAQSSMIGNAVNFPFPEIREAWQYADLGPAFRTPVRSSIPVLFVTGELDGNTPPSQAEEVRAGFPNSFHLVITNGGHTSAFSSEEAAETLVEFLKGRDISKVRLEMPRPRFSPLRR